MIGQLLPSCMCGKDRMCTGVVCQCREVACDCPLAAHRRLMARVHELQVAAKPPQQTFDFQHVVQVRVRGTQAQIVKVHELLLQFAKEAAIRRGPRTAGLGTSGPVGGEDGVEQWAVGFWIAPGLLLRLQSFLLEIGLTEEKG